MVLQDAFGNYHCDINPATPPDPASGRCCSSGIGAPDDADGENGMYYVDLSTGDLYIKTNNVWTIYSGGGASNLNGNGSPVGVVTPDAINQWYRDDLTDNYWWATGATNADWTPVV
jgi:hypothetical protein